jgi:tetratricopeptide (TPR) repeat protein
MTIVLALWVAMQSADVAAGIQALDTAKFEEAEKAFERAVKTDAQDYSALFYLSLAQTFLNKDDEAMAGFRRVLEMKPGLFEAEVNLGLLEFRHRKFEAAIGTLEKARAAKPDDVRTVFHLAEAYRETGKCDAAEPLYRRSGELDSSLVAAQLGLARCLATRGKLEEAAPLFLASGGALELAQAYEDADQIEKAVPLYEAALKEDPTPAVTTRLFDLRLTQGRQLRDRKQYAAAAQEFAKAAQLQPDSVEALNELAAVFILLNEDARAIAVLDRLKSLNAETPGHLFFRAVVFDRNKQAKLALQAYQAFLAASNGQYPDEEFKARQRARILEKEAKRR